MDRTDEPNLKELVAFLRRGLGFALLAGALATVLTYFVARDLDPTYEAHASLVVSVQDPDQRDFGATLATAPVLESAAYRAAIRGRSVLTDVLRDLSGTMPTAAAVDALAAALKVRTEDSRISSVIRLSVRSGDARHASELAHTVARAAIAWDEQRATRGIETIIESLEAQIAAIALETTSTTVTTQVEGLQRTADQLHLRLASARALRAGAVGGLTLLEDAEVPRVAVAPRPVRSAAVAGSLAFFTVFGLLLLRDALDTRVRSVAELAKLTGLPVMAQFPRVSTGRRGIPADAASHLRTAVGFATADAHPKVILVTSGPAMNGKSTVAIALAESFARLDYRTMLIDADLRHPVLASVYGIARRRTNPLEKVLKLPATQVAPAQIVIGEKIQVDLIPTFEAVPDPGELLAQRLPALLDRLRSAYDVIVIDSAPILPVADSLAIAPHCTGVVLAVSMTDAERRSVVATLDLLRRAGVRMMGMVATNLVRTDRDGRRYGHASAFDDAQPAPTVLQPVVTPVTVQWGSGAVREPSSSVLLRGRGRAGYPRRK